jgi:hypothetical protein
MGILWDHPGQACWWEEPFYLEHQVSACKNPRIDILGLENHLKVLAEVESNKVMKALTSGVEADSLTP